MPGGRDQPGSSPAGVDQAFIRQMRQRFEEELARKEKETIAYWREELDKALKRRRADLAGLLNELKALQERMNKRMAVL
ncbi:MAG: hypothetical protein AB1641_30510 [Thermodesulfobacteriota bacterium]